MSTSQDELKIYAKELRKSTRKVFKKYSQIADEYSNLRQWIDNIFHIFNYHFLFRELEDQASDFINDLDNLGLMERDNYSLVFGYHSDKDELEQFSPLFQAVIEDRMIFVDNEFIKKHFELIINYDITKIMKINHYKFESFNRIAQAINWNLSIWESQRNGNFGNEATRKIIKENINYIFKKKTKYSSSHNPGKYESFITLVAYDMINDIKLIEKIIDLDSDISITDDKTLSFIRQFIFFDHKSDFDTRVRDLYKNFIPESFPIITKYGFENFYWLLRNNLSIKYKALGALR